MLGTICWPNEEWILKIKQFLLATGVSGGMDWPTSADESGNWAGPFSLWKKVFRRPPPVRKAANESAIKNCHELVILNDSTITYNWNQLNYDFGRSPMYRSPFWYSWTVPLSTEKFPEAVIMWLDLNFDRPFVGRTSIEPLVVHQLCFRQWSINKETLFIEESSRESLLVTIEQSR